MTQEKLPSKVFRLLRVLIPGTPPDRVDSEKAPRKQTTRRVGKRPTKSLVPPVRDVDRFLDTTWYWTKPVGSVVVRHYKEDDFEKLREDVEASARHGWVAQTIVTQPGHTNVGRTALRMALGVGLIFGASRTKGVTGVRFTRVNQGEGRKQTK
jgi:hypothetical protein